MWEEDTSVDRAYTALGGETEPGATSGAARTVNASQGRRAEPCLDDTEAAVVPPPDHQHHAYPKAQTRQERATAHPPAP